MNREGLHTVRSQFLLIGLLFFITTVFAAVMATRHDWFESFVKEKFSPLPPHLYPLVEASTRNELNVEDIAKLPRHDLLALYDHWMGMPQLPSLTMPGALMVVDRGVYIERLEQTLVCGTPEQRQRALYFIELAGSQEAIQMLQRVQEWAERRKIPDLPRATAETITLIKSGKSGFSGSAHSTSTAVRPKTLED